MCILKFEVLSVSESYLPESVSSHEAALVHVAVDTVKMSFTGILPHDIFFSVSEHGLL